MNYLSTSRVSTNTSTANPSPIQADMDIPSLSLGSFSLGPSLGTYSRNSTAHCTEGHDSRSVFAQASEKSIHILSSDQQLSQTLDFWKSFDQIANTRDTEKVPIESICLSYNQQRNETLLFASAGHVILVWAATATSSSTNRWRIHTSVAVGEEAVYDMDSNGDFLLVGTDNHLVLLSCRQDASQHWTVLRKIKSPKPVKSCKLCSNENLFAAVLRNDYKVFVWSIKSNAKSTTLSRTSLLRHSRTVTLLEWREQPSEDVSSNVLITQTEDGVSRIWAPVIDDPSKFRLTSVTDPRSMEVESKEDSDCSPAIYLSARNMSQIIQNNLRGLHRDLQMAELGIGSKNNVSGQDFELKRSRTRRLESLLMDTPDMFLRVDRWGNLILKAVANIDRKPPTICESFVVLKMRLPSITDGKAVEDAQLIPSSSLSSLACYDSSGYLLLHFEKNEIKRVKINAALFFDGQGEGVVSVYGPSRTTSTNQISRLPTESKSSSMNGYKASFSPLDRPHVKIFCEADTFLAEAPEASFDLEEDLVQLSWSQSTRWSNEPMLAIVCTHTVHILGPRQLSITQQNENRWTEIARISVETLLSASLTAVDWSDTNQLIVHTGSQTLVFEDELLYPSQNRRTRTRTLEEEMALRTSVLPDYSASVLHECVRWGWLPEAISALRAMASNSDGNMRQYENLIDWSQLGNALSHLTESEFVAHKNTITTYAGDVEEDDTLVERLRKSNDGEEEGHLRISTIARAALHINRFQNVLDHWAQIYLVDQQCLADTCLLADDQPNQDWYIKIRSQHFVWAWHSQTQSALIQCISSLYKAPLNWTMARQLGITIWLRSHEVLRSFTEEVARGQYNSGDERDPTIPSIFYYALGKVQVVTNLWRQAIWHPDQMKMFQFLKNDFTLDRWRSAALKNAFALLSQRRFGMCTVINNFSSLMGLMNLQKWLQAFSC